MPPESKKAAHQRDAELVRLALTGDEAAIELLSRRLEYVPTVLAGLNARRGGVLSSHDLEDLSQDVLARIWTKLATYAGRATLKSWFFGFCYLEFMNRLRTKSRALQSVPADVGELAVAPPSRPDESHALEEFVRGLHELSPREAELLLQRHSDGRTFDEISTHLEEPVNTVKARYYRSLKKLRPRLGRGSEGK